MAGKLYSLIGLARAGKSTFANNWVMEKPCRVIASGDDLRKGLYSKRYITELEPLVHGIYPTFIKTLLQRHDVLCDDTHTTIKSIRQILEINIDTEFIFIDTPAKICKQRAIDTSQPDLVDVIDRMDENLYKLMNYLSFNPHYSAINETQRYRQDCIHQTIEKIRQEVKEEIQQFNREV